MRGFKISCGIFLTILTQPFFFSSAFAETYAEAVTHAQNNIDNNTNFIPAAGIILIRPGSADYGLTYESYGGTNYLYTRTFTKSKNIFNSSTQTLTGVGDAQIFGSPTTDAAWVTVGNDTTRFLDAQGATAATVTDLLERGLGMNNDSSHNSIVEYAVLPDNDHMMRPTRKPDIANYSTVSSDYAFSDNYFYFVLDNNRAYLRDLAGKKSIKPKSYRSIALRIENISNVSLIFFVCLLCV